MRLVRMGLAVLILALSLGTAQAARDDVDYLGLATLLLRDGHVQRAAQALGHVKESEPTLDRIRFFTLKAVIALRQQKHRDALVAFEKAIQAGAKDPQLQLSRARSAFALKECEVVLNALTAAGSRANAESDYFLMRAHCLWAVDRRAHALAALVDGHKAFPAHKAFVRRRIHRLMQLNLFREAAQVGQSFLERPDSDEDDVAFVSQALIKSKQSKLAIPILETALLRFPDAKKLRVQSAHAWLKSGHPQTAARIFESLSFRDPNHARDAAEIYREHDRLDRALKLNGRILDQAAKVRQRIAILLDLERFDGVVALAPRLSRLKLLTQDEELRYALAYAYFRLGQYGQAEGHLKKLQSPELFRRAAELRKAMAECQQANGQCD
ncbi:MAG: hypothetical protein VX589_14520 [Myxococcota bacterium]|nr:hypothetical protein [Myxococcota bacterium]